MTNEHTRRLSFVNHEFREAHLEPLYGVICRCNHAGDKLAAVLCDLGFDAEVINEGDGEYLATFLVVPSQPFSILFRCELDKECSPNFMIQLSAMYDTEKEDPVIRAIHGEFAIFENQICDFLESLPQTKVLKRERKGEGSLGNNGFLRTHVEVESTYFQVPAFSAETSRLVDAPFLATELAEFTTNIGKEVLPEGQDDKFCVTIPIEDESGYNTVFCQISGAQDHWVVTITPYFGDDNYHYPQALADAQSVYNRLRDWLTKDSETKNLTLDPTDPNYFPDV